MPEEKDTLSTVGTIGILVGVFLILTSLIRALVHNLAIRIFGYLVGIILWLNLVFWALAHLGVLIPKEVAKENTIAAWEKCLLFTGSAYGIVLVLAIIFHFKEKHDMQKAHEAMYAVTYSDSYDEDDDELYY